MVDFMYSDFWEREGTSQIFSGALK